MGDRRALTGPLRPGLSRDWEGAVQVSRDFIDPVRLSRGQMTTFGLRPSTVPFALTLSPGGLACGSWGRARFHGTCKVEGDHLLV